MQSTDWAREHSDALREYFGHGMSFSEIAEAFHYLASPAASIWPAFTSMAPRLIALRRRVVGAALRRLVGLVHVW